MTESKKDSVSETASTPEDLHAADAGMSEAERRVAVVRALAAMPSIPAQRACEAAAELGISTSRLNDLVRAWRLHGRVSTAMKGRLEENRYADALAAAEGPLDLSGVEPDRRDEIRRRIDIISRYLRSGTFDRSTIQGLADEYGTSYRAFRNAINAWLTSPDPAKLPGASRVASAGVAGSLSKDSEVERAVDLAIAELGRDAGATAVHRRVAQICHAEGMKAPGVSLVYKRLLRARSGPALIGRDDTIRLDRVRIAAPGMLDMHAGSQTLTLLFGSTSGRIFSHHLTDRAPSVASDALVLAANASAGGAGPAAMLEARFPPGEHWNELIRILVAGGVALLGSERRTPASGRLARSTFGKAIGDLPFDRIDRRYVPQRCPQEQLIACSRAVDRSIANHNAGRSNDVGPLATAERANELSSLLLELARPHTG